MLGFIAFRVMLVKYMILLHKFSEVKRKRGTFFYPISYRVILRDMYIPSEYICMYILIEYVCIYQQCMYVYTSSVCMYTQWQCMYCMYCPSYTSKNSHFYIYIYIISLNS